MDISWFDATCGFSSGYTSSILALIASARMREVLPHARGAHGLVQALNGGGARVSDVGSFIVLEHQYPWSRPITSFESAGHLHLEYTLHELLVVQILERNRVCSSHSPPRYYPLRVSQDVLGA